jgi:hypothetical protein
MFVVVPHQHPEGPDNVAVTLADGGAATIIGGLVKQLRRERSRTNHIRRRLQSPQLPSC